MRARARASAGSEWLRPGFCLRRGRAEIYCGRAPLNRTSRHGRILSVVSSPLPIIKQPRGARAHPKKSPGPSQTIAAISNPRQLGVARDLHPAHAPASRPDAPASPTLHIFQSLAPCLPPSVCLPGARCYPHGAATPAVAAAAATFRATSIPALTRLHDVHFPPTPNDDAPSIAASVDATICRFRFLDARFCYRDLELQPRSNRAATTSDIRPRPPRHAPYISRD